MYIMCVTARWIQALVNVWACGVIGIIGKLIFALLSMKKNTHLCRIEIEVEIFVIEAGEGCLLSAEVK